MVFTILGSGTSQGVPVVACDCEACHSQDTRDKRLRASLHLKTDALSLVIDAGPDFRQQMLRYNITQLDAILYTHQHKDHTAGLDDIRGFNFRQKQNMPLYGRKAVLEQIRKEFSYIFEPEYLHEGLPRASLHPINASPFALHGLEILPIEAMHHRLPVFGFRIGPLSYVTDVNHIASAERDKIRGSEVLILDALRLQPHPAHFTLAEAIEVAEDIGADRTYFTHISHLMGKHEEVSSRLPKGMALAEDGMRFSF